MRVVARLPPINASMSFVAARHVRVLLPPFEKGVSLHLGSEGDGRRLNVLSSLVTPYSSAPHDVSNQGKHIGHQSSGNELPGTFFGKQDYALRWGYSLYHFLRVI